jgi:hypothetical protein
MWHGKGDGLLHSRMVHQHFIHFTRGDFFAAPVDDFFEPAGDA